VHVTKEQSGSGRGLASDSDDPFAVWPTLQQILDAGDDEEDDEEGGEQVHEHKHARGVSAVAQGGVIEIYNGASEVQEALNALEAGK